jgi:hypothetical protein
VAEGGLSSLGVCPSAGFDRPMLFSGMRSAMDPSITAAADANVMAENARSCSMCGNLLGYTRDVPQQSNVTLFTFTTKKSDSVLEKLGSWRASIQLQVDIEGRMLNFLLPHDAKESYSCAAVTAKLQARRGMQLKIQTNTASLNKKITAVMTSVMSHLVSLEATRDDLCVSRSTSLDPDDHGSEIRCHDSTGE